MLKLKFYPYTYVRTNVMRTKLLKKEDYYNMLKMGVNEVETFLQSRGYTDFSSLATTYSGIELAEMSMRANLIKSFQKLRRISNENLKKLIDAYLMRYDIHNIKAIFRGIISSIDQKDVEDILMPVGVYGEEFYKKLALLNMDDAIKQLRLTVFREVFIKLANPNLHLLETKLDDFYYNYLISFSDQLSDEGKLFVKMVYEEINVVNIITFLRLKKVKKSQEEIQQYLIKPSKLISQLFRAETSDQILNILKKSKYSKYITEGIDSYVKDGSLSLLEKDLQVYLLGLIKLFIHQNILSINTIIGYLFSKDLEINNILLVVKSKILHIDDKIVKRQLVI